MYLPFPIESHANRLIATIESKGGWGKNNFKKKKNAGRSLISTVDTHTHTHTHHTAGSRPRPAAPTGTARRRDARRPPGRPAAPGTAGRSAVPGPAPVGPRPPAQGRQPGRKTHPSTSPTSLSLSLFLFEFFVEFRLCGRRERRRRYWTNMSKPNAEAHDPVKSSPVDSDDFKVESSFGVRQLWPSWP